MAFKGLESKIVINKQSVDRKSKKLKFLECTLSFEEEIDVCNKIVKYNYVNWTIYSTLKNTVRRGTIMKFY